MKTRVGWIPSVAASLGFFGPVPEEKEMSPPLGVAALSRYE